MATFPTYTDQVLREGHENTTYFEAAEDVKEGQVVKADTGASGRTIEPSDANGEGRLVGVALETRSSGEMVAVATQGAVVSGVSATGAITSGDFVSSAGGTTEGAVDKAATGDAIIGQAYLDDTGTNTEGTVLFEVVKAWAHGTA